MTGCRSALLAGGFMILSIRDGFAEFTFWREVAPGIIATAFKSELMTYGPIAPQFGNSDLAAALPASAVVLKKEACRFLF